MISLPFAVSTLSYLDSTISGVSNESIIDASSSCVGSLAPLLHDAIMKMPQQIDSIFFFIVLLLFACLFFHPVLSHLSEFRFRPEEYRPIIIHEDEE